MVQRLAPKPGLPPAKFYANKENKMNTKQKHEILSEIIDRNEHGQHFTDVYSAANLRELETLKLIRVTRHANGVPLPPERFTVLLTDRGAQIICESEAEYEAIYHYAPNRGEEPEDFGL